MKYTINSLLVILLLFSFYKLYKDFTKHQKDINNIQNTKKSVYKLNINSKLIYNLQKERGLASIYFASQNDEFLNKLNEQKLLTDKIIEEALKYKDVKNLSKIRNETYKKMQNGLYTSEELFQIATSVISNLSINSQEIILNTNRNLLKNSLIIHNNLNLAQEAFGRIRAIVGISIKSNNDFHKRKHQIISQYALFEHYIGQLNNINVFNKDFHNTKCFNQSKIILNDLLKADKLKINSLEWFEISTCAIDTIHEYVHKEYDNITKIIEQSIIKSTRQRNINLIIWASIYLVLLLLILTSIKKSALIKKEESLLQNYKDAIDYSTIVSKTDLNGKITYANDEFCKLSGFTRDEVLGKNHNIIRHEDMKDEVFKDMWETIGSGKKWHGILKNKTKDKKPYWVKAYVIPIINEYDNITEYIAIRHDITDIKNLSIEIEETQRDLMYKLAEAVESRSKETGFHIQRVSHYSKLLASLAGLSKKDCETIFISSSLHDIGKISIPDSILLKPGKLTKEEWEIMKTHAQTGYNILSNSNRPLLRAAAIIAKDHHEHYDGNGYPLGLKEEDISIFGRIVSIVDVFDALATTRAYKKAWELEDILKLLEDGSGKQFDPKLIKLFFDNLDKFLEIRDSLEEK